MNQRPEHWWDEERFRRERMNQPVCANCDQPRDVIAQSENPMYCAKAPRTAHGVDRARYRTDPVYHALITRTRHLMQAYRRGQINDGLERVRRRDEEERAYRTARTIEVGLR